MPRHIRAIHVKPTRIILGYLFLKHFFYNDCKNNKELTESQNRIKAFKRLLNYMQTNKIPISVITPLLDRYELKLKDISVEKICSLFNIILRIMILKILDITM